MSALNERCWFCKEREPAPGQEREVRLTKRIGMSIERTTTRVPRCAVCNARHRRVNLIGLSIGLGAAGIVIAVLCLWRPFDTPVWLRVALALAALAIGGSFIGRRWGLPPGTEPETALATYPDVVAAKNAGWVIDEAVLR